MELPDGHVVVEDRASSCHGQRVCHQTRGTDAAHSPLHVLSPRGGAAGLTICLTSPRIKIKLEVHYNYSSLHFNMMLSSYSIPC